MQREHEYTILGRRYCQRELTVLRCQKLSTTEAWTVLQSAESTGMEIFMSPEQCAEFFNAVLIPVVDGQARPGEFAEFTAADFAQIALSEVGAVFGHFCFFNPSLTQCLVGLTGLWQALDGLQSVVQAGADPSIGSILPLSPAAETLPN